VETLANCAFIGDQVVLLKPRPGHPQRTCRTRSAFPKDPRSRCVCTKWRKQRWRFLVVRDPKVKEAIGALYKRAWDEQVAPRYRAGEPAPGTSRERFERMLAAAEHLAKHIHEAPYGSSLA
jgi:hypothetical protein